MNERHLVLAGWLVALVAISMAGMGLVPSQGVGLPGDEGDDGAATLEEMLSASAPRTDRLTTSTTPVVHDPDRTLVVAAPERAPMTGEVDALDRLLRQGGTAVLFVASEAWNDALAPYGITLHGALLLDSQDEDSTSFPVEMPDELGGGQMVLVNATAITDSGPGVQTASADRDLVLDLDGDRRISVPPDTAGPFPTVAYTSVGPGTLVVVASGDAALNEDIGRHLDGMERLFEAQASRGAFLDASTHPMGLVDAVRGPARVLASLLHASIAGAGVGLIAIGAAVYASPRLRGDAGRERTSLDDRSPETEEWLNRGNP